MHRTVLASLLLTGLAAPGLCPSVLAADGGPRHRPLVELFTSQG